MTDHFGRNTQLVLTVAIVSSYAILQDKITSERVLRKTDDLINQIQISVYDSVGVMGDFWGESRKDQPDERALQLIKRRADASMAELGRLHSALLQGRAELQETDVWSEIGWVIDFSPGSTNHQLNQYLERNAVALSGDTRGTPQRPIEAAGAYNGAMLAGYQDASRALNLIIDEFALEVASVHKLLTIAIVVTMVMVSALVIAPLWTRLNKEHRLVVEAHENLRQIAFVDRETGLPNLDGLQNSLTRDDAIGSGAQPCHLLLVRITNLDELYGLIGSHRSSALAQLLSQRLSEWGSEQLNWCRSGEAEFCCIVSDNRVRRSEAWIGTLHQHLTSRLVIGGIVVRPDVSIASSAIDNARSFFDGLLWEHQSNARLASFEYQSKEGVLPEYSASHKQALANKNQLINQISEAIDSRQIVPFYQFKVDALTGEISSIEVLARWVKPDQSLVSPGVFIPVAESSGLITRLTYALFEQVSIDVQRWCASGYNIGRVAVNVAGDTLHDGELLDRLAAMIDRLPEGCEGLDVEITENIAIGNNIEETEAVFKKIQGLGVRIAIDDFGTGYASLQTLLDMPIDILKIDRSFVLPMAETGEGNEVVSAMISLSKKLNKYCVVEGVETQWQWQQLAHLGADELQGFHFFKPASADEIANVLSGWDGLKLTA